VAEAGGLEVQAQIEEAEEALLVRLEGKDREFFLEPDGKAEVLQATEHLLLRLYGAQLQPRAVRLTGEGFRERRDEALAAEARRIAAEVRASGEARTLPRLNAYERRVVHMTLQAEPGIRTSSAGEGAERRLTVAPADSGAGGPTAE
jgi:spoIIIJ-associated protein